MPRRIQEFTPDIQGIAKWGAEWHYQSMVFIGYVVYILGVFLNLLAWTTQSPVGWVFVLLVIQTLTLLVILSFSMINRGNGPKERRFLFWALSFLVFTFLPLVHEYWMPMLSNLKKS